MNSTTADTLKRVAWTFALAFVGAFITLAPGLLAAPNMKDAKAALVAAIGAAIAAAGSAIKNVTLKPGSAAR